MNGKTEIHLWTKEQLLERVKCLENRLSQYKEKLESFRLNLNAQEAITKALKGNSHKLSKKFHEELTKALNKMHDEKMAAIEHLRFSIAQALRAEIKEYPEQFKEYLEIFIKDKLGVN